MTAVPPDKLILASAGTGKTYQLSGRFLALLFAGVAPERILATTFTRKAAGEILDRVLRRLVDAVEDERALAALNAQLVEEGQAPATAERCVALLAELARGLHRFRIRTLDAFFAQLGGVFALELGLPPGWRILEEDEKTALGREALADALEGADRVELLELLRALQKTGASRSVEFSLLNAVEDGRDAFLESRASSWDRVNVPPGLAEEGLAAALADLEALALPLTKAGKPDKTWSRAQGRLLELARAGAWEAALKSGFLQKLADGETKFGRHELDEGQLAVLEPLLEHAAHSILAGLRAQNLASLDWLGRFEEAFQSRKDALSGLSFEDVPRALAPPDDVSLAARGFDLGYRLDGRVDHLLLDEFQDTAPPQWRVLAPLADEVIGDHSGERSFFCVGDVKQAIYAWRSGEPRLLSGMNARYPALPAPTELTENWRSSPVVLDTVDRVFAGIGSNGAFKDGAPRAAAEAFEAEYAPHVAARELAGAAELREAPEAPDGALKILPALQLAADRAAAIARGAPHATIAVLLRRNNHVARAIDLLRRRGLRASGEGGNPLVDSAAVLHALSALHLADHPADGAAAFLVATSPLAEALGASEADVEDPVGLSRSLRERLARRGFGELLAELLPAVAAAPEYGPWDAKRFAQLVDLGYAFDRREPLRATAFLDYVRETRVEDPSSTQVKVMTIHASKGLEFDAVILPELDLTMTIREPNVLRGRPEPDRLLEGVSASRSHAICGLDPEGLGALRHEEDRRHVQEALCLLYVAMTRAAHRLELIVSAGKPKAASYANVLRAALLATESADLGGEPGLLWRHPDSSAEAWPEPRAAAEEPAAGGAGASQPGARVPRFDAPAAPRDLLRKSPSAEEGGHRLDVRELLQSRRGRGFTRGSLIHRWLQEVEWLEDFALDDAGLDVLGRPLEPDAAARAEALAAFRAALEQPEVGALLRRPAAEGAELEVWRERDFAEVVEEDGEPVLWTGTFDRVLLRREGGHVTSAEVIDWKTDRVAAAGVNERAAFYAPQIESYRRVLARMTGTEPEAIVAKLAFLEPGVVRRIDRAARTGS